MTRMRSACLVLLGFAACGDASTDGFVSEYFEIEPSDSDVVCRGTLAEIDAQIVRVKDTLGLPLLSPLLIDYGLAAVEEYCSAITDNFAVGGCASGSLDSTHIAAKYSSVYHEIVHGVRRANGKRGPNFFEEGIAEVLSGFHPFPYDVEIRADDIKRGPKFLAMLPQMEIEAYDYAIAGHFMSWLFATYGDATVVAFLNDDELATDVESVFSNHFGLSLQDAENDWRTSSEEIYTWGNVCDPARDLTWDGSAIEFKGRVDCDASNTIGPSILGTIRTRSNCFTLEQAGSPRVEFTASGGAAEFRQQYCSGPAGPLSPEHYQEKQVMAGEALDLPFSQCTWEVAIATELERPIDFTLRLTRP